MLRGSLQVVLLCSYHIQFAANCFDVQSTWNKRIIFYTQKVLKGNGLQYWGWFICSAYWSKLELEMEEISQVWLWNNSAPYLPSCWASITRSSSAVALSCSSDRARAFRSFWHSESRSSSWHCITYIRSGNDLNPGVKIVLQAFFCFGLKVMLIKSSCNKTS